MSDNYVSTADETNRALGGLVGGVVKEVLLRREGPKDRTCYIISVLKAALHRNHFWLEPGAKVDDPTLYLGSMITSAGVKDEAILFEFDNGGYLRMPIQFDEPSGTST